MLIFLFIATALNLNAFSAPVTTPINVLDPLPPLSILGRDIPIPGYIDPTRYRAIQEIILSCLATIFACTWVSLHPNVPDPRNSGRKNFMVRTRTMLLALIGPEFITIWAFRQRMAATKHADAYNKELTPKPESRPIWRCIMHRFYGAGEDRGPNRIWTLTHGFLLEMHGLVAFRGDHLPPIDKDKYPNASSQAKTLEKLGRHGVVLHPSQLHRFDMSEDMINDKSKGDSFTKLFAVVQTSWFIVQCATRWVLRLYVTELEIVTLAFGILNVITYFLWWHKPQDMGFAIPIQKGREEVAVQTDTYREVAVQTDIPILRSEVAVQTDMGLAIPILDKGRREVDAREDNVYSVLRCAILGLFNTCWEFIKGLNPFSAYCIMIGDDLGFGTSEVKAAFYSSTYGTTTSEGGSAVGFAVGFIGLLFGGVHLLPIRLSTFSSTREQHLWIASTICILVEPILVCLVGQVLNPGDGLHLVFAIPHTIGFLLYVVARLTLIVLAFTTLRSLPSNAFVNIEWSTFFPHI